MNDFDPDDIPYDIDLEYFEEVLEQCTRSFESNSIENRLKMARVKENPRGKSLMYRRSNRSS